jgi:hypothetical protein
MLVWDFCAGDTQGCTNIGEVTRFPEDGRSHSTGYKGVLVSLGDEWSGLTLLWIDKVLGASLILLATSRVFWMAHHSLWPHKMALRNC